MIKVLIKLGIERIYLNIIKVENSLYNIANIV
jgi:hypothetical protein